MLCGRLRAGRRWVRAEVVVNDVYNGSTIEFFFKLTVEFVLEST